MKKYFIRRIPGTETHGIYLSEKRHYTDGMYPIGYMVKGETGWHCSTKFGDGERTFKTRREGVAWVVAAYEMREGSSRHEFHKGEHYRQLADELLATWKTSEKEPEPKTMQEAESQVEVLKTRIKELETEVEELNKRVAELTHERVSVHAAARIAMGLLEEI